MSGGKAFRDGEEVQPIVEYNPKNDKPLDFSGFTANYPAALAMRRNAAWCSIAEAIRKKLKDEKILEAVKKLGINNGFVHDPVNDGEYLLDLRSAIAADYVSAHIGVLIK